MKEKKLITVFFLANMIDTTTTSYLLTQEGWQELNLFANQKISNGEMYEVLILKLAVTAILIGTYALAKAGRSRWEYPIEKALSIGNLVIWIVLIWNAINIFATMVL